MAGLDGDATSSTIYIDDLIATNPESGDAKSQGDDHLRFIKKVLKNTFANITGPVTADQSELNILDGATLTTTELNYVDGVTSAIQTQLTAKAPAASPTFTGTVVLPSTTSIGDVSDTELAFLNGVTSALQTQIDGKLTKTAAFGIQFNLDYGADGDYTLDQDASFAYTISGAVFQTASGTITANVKINGTSVTGLSALSLSSSEGSGTATAANSVAAGDKVTVTLSSNSSAVGVSLKLNCVRV